MAQRYIGALAQQAKPDNLFLVRSSLDQVPTQVRDSINALDIKGDLGGPDVGQARAAAKK